MCSPNYKNRAGFNLLIINTNHAKFLLIKNCWYMAFCKCFSMSVPHGRPGLWKIIYTLPNQTYINYGSLIANRKWGTISPYLNEALWDTTAKELFL